MNPVYCPECDHELVDVNEGYFRLRYGHQELECVNPECPRCPNYTPPGKIAPTEQEIK